MLRPAADDQVLRSSGDREIAVVVERAEVPGAKPAVRGERLGGLVRLVPVARRHVRTLDLDLAVRAGLACLALRIDDADRHTRQAADRRSRACARRAAGSTRSCRFPSCRSARGRDGRSAARTRETSREAAARIRRRTGACRRTPRDRACPRRAGAYRTSGHPSSRLHAAAGGRLPSRRTSAATARDIRRSARSAARRTGRARGRQAVRAAARRRA